MTGSELKARRQALGLSQFQLGLALARWLGRPVSQNTIACWEAGRFRIRYPGIIERALADLEREHAQLASHDARD